MKMILVLALTLLSTQAFARGGGSSVGTGNPASQLCIDLGGELEPVQTPEGQYDNCVVPEWDLFTEMNKRHLVKPIHCNPNMPCMPNPAAKNCVDIGGELRTVETPDGQQGVCAVEEWKLWKVFNTKKR